MGSARDTKKAHMESMLFGVFRGRWATGVFLLIFFFGFILFVGGKEKRREGEKREPMFVRVSRLDAAHVR